MSRLVTMLLLAAHAIGALVLGWRAPRGFDFLSLSFFASEALPVLVFTGAAVAIIRRGRAVTSLSFSGMWLGGALAALLLFPASTWRFILIAAPLGLALALLSWREASRRGVAIVLGLMGGIGWTAAQRAPDPSTHPLGGEVLEQLAGKLVPLKCGGLGVTVEPILTFESCADDRFWAIWADRRCPEPDAWATQVRAETGITIVEAQTRYAVPVFSHLNSFTTVGFDRGDLRASISGGPPDSFTTHEDSSRFAWLRSDGTLITARATENEKGPFNELATTKADRLVVVLSDADGLVCRLTFETWAAQSSIAPSPTAGWGVAQNALELLEAPDHSSSALVLSLAATSIGRGWDTVGHTAGIYRNVIRLEPLR